MPTSSHALDFIALIGEEYKSWRPSLCNFFCPLSPASHLGPNILFNNLLSNSNKFSSHRMTDKVTPVEEGERTPSRSGRFWISLSNVTSYRPGNLGSILGKARISLLAVTSTSNVGPTQPPNQGTERIWSWPLTYF